MVKLFDYVKIIDIYHPLYGSSGQLTDYDTIEKSFIMHFDKKFSSGAIYWNSKSTRVRRNQVTKISKFDLPKYNQVLKNEC